MNQDPSFTVTLPSTTNVGAGATSTINVVVSAVSINAQAVLNIVVNTTLGGYQNALMMPFTIIGGQGNNVNKFTNGGFIASTLNQHNIPSSVNFNFSLPSNVVANSSTLSMNVYGSVFAIWQEALNQFQSQP
jgi:hypothetical protein